MRRHLRNPWIWVAAAILFAAWLFWPRTVQSPAPHEVPPAQSAPATGGVAVADSAAVDTAPRSAPALDLPPEALHTLQLIARGGPFPHRQDGQVFGNRERLLPPKPRGYYHEYTVETPGAGNRGTRRIITGGQPVEAWYYTDDHYASFRAFDGARAR
ncbi:ribonuclease [Lysobacter helvus]|uniref:Ribonuclease n=2 Tax=Lysobacteraceae TaxID=32033 RepID=A0ABM7Q9E8_9GAMM|nr:ribonuclease [Lysobacter caseinilyticus]BCT97244.1 ribonuclease [Lysobacter helvus]